MECGLSIIRGCGKMLMSIASNGTESTGGVAMGTNGVVREDDTWKVVARNFSKATDNKIHSDEIARKYGFKSALVPGVAVYGHLTYPLVHRYGEQWLSHSQHNVRFLKPAYHQDELKIELTEDESGSHVDCHNSEGVLLAQLHSTSPDGQTEFAQRSDFSATTKDPARIEMIWETVQPMQPFAEWHFQITDDSNRTFTEQIADPLSLYRHVAHPHWLLSVANQSLTREYVMPAWLHVESEVRYRALVRVGDTLAVKAVPLEKWRRKGHEFVRLYLAYYRDDVLTTEILHTAIFKVAE